MYALVFEWIMRCLGEIKKIYFTMYEVYIFCPENYDFDNMNARVVPLRVERGVSPANETLL